MDVDGDLELQDEGTNAEAMDSDLDSAIEDMEVIGVDLSAIQPDLHLEPGGYFEVQDLELPSYCDDGSVPPDAALYRWQHALVDASNEVGRPINYAVDCLDDLHNVGFVEIHHQIYKWPFNNWPDDPKLKEAGRWNCANLDMGLEAFSLGLLTRVKGWTRDAVEELCAEVKKEVKDTRLHAYWRQ
ncbi:hypothetical protein COL516b_007160 [Colletotrichum fioriniae]|nr:uncharacterized protein COL516b_007160 [Colletotrichum fioriniae]KAJ0302621.1 hypothetical protein COL516b_007160 [Colletotrichum fioriniae]